MKKTTVAVLIVAVIICGALLMARAEGPGDEDIAQKLDSIIENQKTILSELANIKNELAIVKIRVTQAQ